MRSKFKKHIPKKPKYPPLIDLKGKKVGDLSVMSRVAGQRAWMCMCSCHKVVKVQHNRLIDNDNPKTHCGCKKTSIAKNFFREYHIWWDNKTRCHNPKHPSYKNFGAKGATMCDIWRNDFTIFLADMGKAPEGALLGRKDETKPYDKENCYWNIIKPKQSSVKLIAHPKTGEQIRVTELAKEMGLTYQQLRSKLIKEEKW